MVKILIHILIARFQALDSPSFCYIVHVTFERVLSVKTLFHVHVVLTVTAYLISILDIIFIHMVL